MKRDIEETLRDWKNDRRRRPLLVRGARQVGKSYTITQFGETEFDNIVIVNFEQNPECKTCFDTLEPQKIIDTISILLHASITPRKTLLFLDEIQECPKAITALRYFYEQMPQLHVVAAGSLLEFALSSAQFKMPVGRVQYVFMKPFSFLEFLDAVGEGRARQAIRGFNWENLPSDVIHDHINSLVKTYSIIGGMPAVIQEYLDTRDLTRCSRVQTLIINTYRDDFGKYCSTVKHKYLQKVFYAVPKMVGKKFKYSHVDDTMQSRELKEALELLEMAGIVSRVKKTSGENLHLEANSKERHFKVLFLDIGLMQNMCGLSAEMLLSEDFIKVNSGALAEQFTAQELIAYQDLYREPSLYYWAREAKSSNAEIDYVFPCLSHVLPIEVKAGKSGTLKSLHLYLDKYHVPVGVRVSQLPFSSTPPIISIPFYGLQKVAQLVKPHLS